MKKFVLLGLSILLSASSFSVSYAGNMVDSAQWLMPAPPSSPPSQGVVFMEPTIYPGSVSKLMGYSTPMAVGDDVPSHVCKSLYEEPCKSANQINYEAYIPKCEKDSSTNCIESVWAFTELGKIDGIFDQYMPLTAPSNFAANLDRNLPEGRGSSIWRIPGLKHGNSSELFALSTVIKGNAYNLSPLAPIPMQEISTTIDPIEMKPGKYDIPHAQGTGWSMGGCLQAGCSGSSNITGYCAALDIDKCAARVPQEGNIRYGVSLRLHNPPAGWIHGRLDAGDFLISNLNGNSTWSIEARPVMIQVQSAWVPNNVASEKMGNKINYPDRSEWQGPLNSGDWAMQTFNKWSPFLTDTASATQFRWSFRTMEGNLPSANYPRGTHDVSACAQNLGVIGEVSTNAMVYQGNPPSWNAENQTLDYKLASPHLQPDGKPFSGIYDLKISKAYAKCLYDLSDLPISATVTIVNETGEGQVGTTTLASDADWIHLVAAGFTFSNPTVKVKFITEKPKAIDSPQIKPVKSVMKKIICTKGRVSKVISGSTPSCPSGFKKK